MSIRVENILQLPIMKDSLLVSSTGLSNPVQYVTVAEAAVINYPNYSEGIFVLTTLSAYHESLEKINAMVKGLCQVNVAAIGIKLGRFINSINPSTIAIAEQYNVALIALPSTVYFRDILSDALSMITGNQKEQLNQINALNADLLNAIVHNRSIQDILNLLCNRLHCYSSCQLSIKEKIAESSSLLEPIDTAAVHEGIQTFFETPQYHEAGYHCGNVYIFPCIPKGRLLAGVCIVCSDTEQETFLPLVQTVINGICIKLLERDLQDQAKHGVVAALLDDIFSSLKTDENLALERLTSLGFVPYSYFLTVTLNGPFIYQDLNWPHILSNIQSIFSLHFQSALAFKRGDKCVVFLSYSTEILTEKLRRKLRSCLAELESIEKSQFLIGCGIPTQNLVLMSECYQQSKKALLFGQAMNEGLKIYLYVDYYEIGLIAHSLSSYETSLFKEMIINPIMEYDAQKNIDLWDTLAACITNKTLEQVAKDLHIHISTLRYRLQKIEALTSYNFFDQDDRLKLHIAYVLHKISKKSSFSPPMDSTFKDSK